jgi:hypothetical protein
MFQRPSLRVGRKTLNFGNLEGRRKFQIFKQFARFAIEIEIFSVTIPMEIFEKCPRIASVTVGSQKVLPIHLPKVYFISDYIIICILQALLMSVKSETLKESDVVFSFYQMNLISRYSKYISHFIKSFARFTSCIKPQDLYGPIGNKLS